MNNTYKCEIKVTDFFGNEFVDYSSYDNLRKIGSICDGQKNGSRKILYTVLEQNINKKIKVSQLAAKVAEYAEYLHGSLESVVVNLAQDYTGTNNLPLLKKNGNFGTRFTPEAAAARYIYTSGTDDFFKLFMKEDIPVLKHQFFEGSEIEPMFYVPSLPILLINGSEGVSSGFAQKILPRNPKEIKKYLGNFLTDKKSRVNLAPFYEGFNGTVQNGETHKQWCIKGAVQKINSNKVQITELPPSYSLKQYTNILDSLEDKKIIQSYRDKSENDVFLFEVTIPSKVLKTWDTETLLIKLKLIKTITENYTCLDENNKIVVYDCIEDVLKHYIRVKLEYINLRKQSLILKSTEDIKLDNSKYLFIKNIVTNKLQINKRKKEHIIKDLELIENIIKKDDSYDYLLNMNILSLTEERMLKLKSSIDEQKLKLKELKQSTPENIWFQDLKNI